MLGDKTIRLLDADGELAAALPDPEREVARNAIVVATRRLRQGNWNPGSGPPAPGHLGFLVLDGILARALSISKGRTVELLGRGDLLRPWQEDAASFDESGWRVVESAEVAELEPGAARLISEYPQLLDVLFARLMSRCRSLAARAAIEAIPGLEERLLALFWHFAESQGSRGPEGVSVPLRLTHQSLAEMVGARRPSVTSALCRLAADGRLQRVAVDEWMLGGEPPGGLNGAITEAPVAARH